MNDFLKKMKILLNDDFELFLQSMDDEPFRGIRVNTLKYDAQKLKSALPYIQDVTAFCKDGYYIDSSAEHIGVHPLHHAGAFYVQEPSAMCAVTMLDVQKEDKVLDLCAAPGSKTTQIASSLGNTGLLWANEIVRSRANILLSNIERCAVKNAVVSSTSPDVLCCALPDFFDKILVDAPCSGEGMFRKDKSSIDQWSVEHSLSCANRQLMILNSAKHSLKPGGVMVYSTCTFSYEENEGVISRFLADNPNFELVDSGCTFGRDTMGYAKRIFPMDGGEGHFAAKLRKNNSDCSPEYIDTKNTKTKHGVFRPFKQADKSVYDFVAEIFDSDMYADLFIKNDKVYALSDQMQSLLSRGIDLQKLSVLRMGVEIAFFKGNRYEPCHNAFTAANADKCKSVIDLSVDDDRMYRYLHGEQILSDKNTKGYTCVCADGVPLGFGKVSNGVLKNKYPKGLRNNG